MDKFFALLLRLFPTLVDYVERRREGERKPTEDIVREHEDRVDRQRDDIDDKIDQKF
jgi:hypothetical protein